MLRALFEGARTREAAALVFTGLSVLLALSLASYNPDDPSFFVAAPGPPANWIGPAGAQAAAALFQLLGLAAWFLPLTLLAAALRRFDPRAGKLRRSAVAGLVIVGVSTGALLALLVGRITYLGSPLPAGGLLGFLLGKGLTSAFSEVGSLLIAGVGMVVGVTLAARSSLADATGALAAALRRATPRAPIRRLARWARTAAPLPRRLPWPFRRRSRGATPSPRPRIAGAPPAAGRLSGAPQADATGASASAPPAAADPSSGSAPAGSRIESAASLGPRAGRRARLARERQARLPVDIAPAPARLPPIELLAPAPPRRLPDRQELLTVARQIESRCHEFAVEGKVLEIHPGPVVTTYEFRPDAGIKLSRVTALADDLALGLEAESIRIDRIPGRPAVGIEVPNRRRDTIALREIIESDVFNRSPDLLTVALGKAQEGEIACASLARMPHLLVAGATGSGKSVGLNGFITSLLYRARPDQVKLILIDPKMLELGLYDGIPHLLVPVVTDMKQASNALRWAVREMERRYRLLASCNTRHLDAFNRLVEQDAGAVAKAIASIPARGETETYEARRLPYVIIVVDELADMLISATQDTEEAIARLAQKARAVGIHLILATQRPSVDVLTGSIKANFPARISYRVASKIDSRTILDASGAERLLGAGDMLYRQPGSARLQRVHGALVAEEENLRVVAWLKDQARPEYDRSVLADPPEGSGASGEGSTDLAADDPVYRKAVRLVVATGQGSTSFLQRRMRLGYSRAARIIDQMEQDGIVGPADGSRPRQILVDADYLERLDQQDE